MYISKELHDLLNHRVKKWDLAENEVGIEHTNRNKPIKVSAQFLKKCKISNKQSL